MKIKNIIHAILFLCVCFAAIVGFAKVSSSKAVPIYDEKQLQLVIDRHHPEFIIKLRSNPTTGYSWNLKSYDSSLVTSVQHHFVAPNTKLIGAPGFEEWKFKATPKAFLNPGKMTLTFEYVRPWQKNSSVNALTFHIQIK